MQQEHERFKLDGAAIPIHRLQQQRIIVYNFNIPIAQSQDIAALERVKQQIVTDLPANANGAITPAYFQITAVYTIVHQGNNDERLWLGSFNPRARDLSQVTAFRPFDANSFVDYCILNGDPDRVRNKLTAVVNGRKSLWTLNTIISIVISVQATVSLNHPIFVNHPRLSHQAHQRRRNVFKIYYD